MGLSGDQADFFIKTGKFLSSPAMLESSAQAVANYQVPMTQMVSRLPPADREQLMSRITTINPQFQASNYDVFKKTEGNFGSGKQGDKIQAISASINHMGVLYDSIDSLKNNNIQGLNRIAQGVGAQIGPTAAQTFQSITQAVGPELSKVYISGTGSEKERSAVEDSFSPKLAPDTLRNNIGARAQLLGGVIQSMMTEYKNGTYGRGQMHTGFFSPESIQTLSRIRPGAVKTITQGQLQNYANRYAQGDQGKARKVFADKNWFVMP
jgi:hypothetical protein